MFLAKNKVIRRCVSSISDESVGEHSDKCHDGVKRTRFMDNKSEFWQVCELGLRWDGVMVRCCHVVVLVLVEWRTDNVEQ